MGSHHLLHCSLPLFSHHNPPSPSFQGAMYNRQMLITSRTDIISVDGHRNRPSPSGEASSLPWSHCAPDCSRKLPVSGRSNTGTAKAWEDESVWSTYDSLGVCKRSDSVKIC
ncbi:hypothetical protein LINPERHAP1_LOCUS32807 [Linum perenne]